MDFCPDYKMSWKEAHVLNSFGTVYYLDIYIDNISQYTSEEYKGKMCKGRWIESMYFDITIALLKW